MNKKLEAAGFTPEQAVAIVAVVKAVAKATAKASTGATASKASKTSKTTRKSKGAKASNDFMKAAVVGTVIRSGETKETTVSGVLKASGLTLSPDEVIATLKAGGTVSTQWKRYTLKQEA
ncbi:MAG: hypothetical protein EOM14_08460 [Clostridia bacterium]|nr:hypothetical protein [Clostridia bacterium]